VNRLRAACCVLRELRYLVASAALILIVSDIAGAQDSTRYVRGTVLNAGNGEAVPRANITVAGSGARAIADDAGRFLLRGVRSGSITVRVRALGYRPTEQVVEVPEFGIVEMEVRLIPAPIMLARIRTRAPSPERDRFEQVPDVGAVTIPGKALSQLPAVGEADVMRVVQTLPGVTARNDFSAGYNVRGGESDQNLVLLDGIPIYNPFHVGGLFSTFLDETVADVKLITGGFPSPYGGRLSSVLDVTSADEARQGVHGTAAVSLLASSLSLGGALPTGVDSWNVAARRTYADKVVGAFTRNILPYHFRDVQAHATHVLPQGGSVSVTAYDGLDLIDGALTGEPDSATLGTGDLRFGWGNQAAGITLMLPLSGGALPIGTDVSIPLGDTASLVQRISITRFSTDLDLGGGSLTFSNRVLEMRLSGALAWQRRNHTVTTGYEFSKHSVDYHVLSPATGVRLLDLTQRPSATSLYFEDLWQYSDKLLLRHGLRGEHVSGTNWYGVSPRVSAKYFLSKDLAVSVAGGQYAQWLHSLRNEDLPIRVFDFWVASDRFVGVSRARHGVAGVEKWFGNSRFVRFESYLKKYARLLEPNEADDPAVRGDEFIGVGGQSYGADIYLRQLESHSLSGWLSYGYGVSTRSKAGVRYFPGQDRRHNLNVVATYRTRNAYVFGSHFNFATGTPYTPIVGQMVRRVYDGTRNAWDTGIQTREIQPVGGDRNAARYPPYHRLDFNVERTWRLRGRSTITPSLQLVNVYDRRNVFTYQWSYLANPPTKTAISQFPILPSIGLTVEF